MGTTTDDEIEDNRVEVTIIATGFKSTIEEKIEATATPVEQKPTIGNPMLSKRLEKLKVSGGYESEEAMEELEKPTWLRRQMD